MGATLTTLMGTGCAPASPASEATGGEASPAGVDPASIIETVECDIVVAGSGTAGTFAAVRAAELGATVLWLERLAERGGTSTYTEGIGVIDSQLMKNAQKDPRKDELFHKFMDSQNWAVSAEILDTYIDGNGPAIDWALGHGAQLAYMPLSDDTYWGGVCFDDQGKFLHMGEGLLSCLWTAGDALPNLELRMSTRLVGLIHEDGKVVGAYAETDGGVIEVRAKAVMLATGGFCGNEEMASDLANVRAGEVTFFGLEGREGDGIKAALQIGAQLHAKEALMYTFGCIKGTTSFDDIVNATFAWNPLVAINQDGRRFANEGFCATSNTANRSLAIRQQKAAWCIADQAHVQAYLDMGQLDYVTGVTQGDLAASLESLPAICKADTLEELALLIGVDADALVASVEAYNAIADGAEDVRFGLDPELAIPVKKAPFYAAQLVASAYSTEGGLLTNASMQVLDANGEPIEGLYALGNDNGSIIGTNYPMHVLGGTAQGWAATGGYLAAHHATQTPLP